MIMFGMVKFGMVKFGMFKQDHLHHVDGICDNRSGTSGRYDTVRKHHRFVWLACPGVNFVLGSLSSRFSSHQAYIGTRISALRAL